MIQERIPLYEFDKNKEAKFSPRHFFDRKLPERCVIAFSRSSVNFVAEKFGANIIDQIGNACCELPVYLVDFEGTPIALTSGMVGSASAAVQMEELIAGGVKKIVACGSCGSLLPKPLGALVIPDSAVRDEGTSYHYAPPFYEIKSDEGVINSIADSLDAIGIPCAFGKTWTTDGFYRETEEKIELRKKQGCCTVEMECAAMTAVAQFRGISFGQILYCGDDLSGAKYDHRNFYNASDIRRMLVEFALKCCKDL